MIYKLNRPSNNKDSCCYIMKDIILLCIAGLNVIILCGCSYMYEKNYSEYRLENDMDKYEYGITSLLRIIESDRNNSNRVYAAAEIGYYSNNNNKGARDILVRIGAEGLLRALRTEEDDYVRGSIIRALMNIQPPNEIVIPIYELGIEKGGRSEVMNSITALKEIDWDLRCYRKKFEEMLNSENDQGKEYGIEALQYMGKYAYDSIGALYYIKDNDLDETIRMLARRAIEKIELDYMMSKEDEE